MSGCIIKSCGVTSSIARNSAGAVSLHRFPKDKETRKRWVQFCNEPDLTNPDAAVLCSRHFDRYDFENVYMEGARKILRKGVVPTIREPVSEDQPNGEKPITRQDRAKIISELLREDEDSSSGAPIQCSIKMEEVDLPLSFPENEEQIIESYSDDGTVLYEEIALDVDEESIDQPEITSVVSVNRCVVPNCKNILQEWFAPFPTNTSLMVRWRECIEVGAGHLLPSMANLRKNGATPVVCSMHFLGFDPTDPSCYRQPTLFFREDIVVEVERCCLCDRMHIKETMVEKDASLTKKFTLRQLATSYFGPTYFDESATAEYLCEECIVKLDMMFKFQQQIIAANQHRGVLRYRMTKEKIVFQQNRFGQDLMIPQESMAAEIANNSSVFDRDLAVIADNSSVFKEVVISSSETDDEPKEQLPVSTSISNQKANKRTTTKKKDVIPRQRTKASCVPDPETKQKLQKSRLTCYLCKTCYDTTALLLSHLMLTHVEGDYHCEECDITFRASPEFNAHLAKHDPDGRPFKCSVCPLRFSYAVGKSKHEADHHGTKDRKKTMQPRTKKFICPTCGKSFREGGALKRHEQFQHRGIPIEHCNVCSMSFASRRNLKRHLQLIHRGERPYKCKYCETSYKQSQQLLDHVNEQHRDEKLKDENADIDAPPNYVCNECNEMFVSRRLLVLHKRKHSAGFSYGSIALVRRNGGESNNQIVCNLCHSLFPKGNEILEHFQTNHPGTPLEYHPCSTCGEIFFKKQHFLIHSYSHTDKYACDQCGKQHSCQIRLQMHKNVNHGVPLADEYYRECPHCNERFPKGSYYTRHIKTHFENEWSCDICYKTYTHKWQLRVHMRTHTGEKPLVCPGCAAKFGDPTTFCKHKKQCPQYVSQTKK